MSGPGSVALEARGVVMRFGGLTALSGFDLSLFGQNLTNEHPILFKSRDLPDDSTDLLYFERGVRPMTVGLSASYRY